MQGPLQAENSDLSIFGPLFGADISVASASGLLKLGLVEQEDFVRVGGLIPDWVLLGARIRLATSDEAGDGVDYIRVSTYCSFLELHNEVFTPPLRFLKRFIDRQETIVQDLNNSIRAELEIREK